jgi:hypothetical protein
VGKISPGDWIGDGGVAARVVAGTALMPRRVEGDKTPRRSIIWAFVNRKKKLCESIRCVGKTRDGASSWELRSLRHAPGVQNDLQLVGGNWPSEHRVSTSSGSALQPSERELSGWKRKKTHHRSLLAFRVHSSR